MGRQAAADCYVVLNTITDRAREHLDDFCMSIGPGRPDARALVCALPADAILSYQTVIVGPSGLDPSVGTDMGEWIRFVEDASPDESNPLRVVNGRGAAASRLCWARCTGGVAVAGSVCSRDACGA